MNQRIRWLNQNRSLGQKEGTSIKLLKSAKDHLRDVAKDRTTFIITHRLPIVSIADRLFHLKDGELAEVLSTPGALRQQLVTQDKT